MISCWVPSARIYGNEVRAQLLGFKQGVNVSEGGIHQTGFDRHKYVCKADKLADL